MNTLFPGRPDYTGPTEGWFGLLHHDRLYEYSSNVMERVRYVKCKKQRHEIATRLHNMIYLGELSGKSGRLDDDYRAKRNRLNTDYWAKRKALDDDYRAKCKPLDDDYWAKRKPLSDDYWAKRKVLSDDYRAKCKPLEAEILTYIKHHIPDCAWNGTELVFPSASEVQR